MKKNRLLDKFLRLKGMSLLLIAQTLLGKIPGQPIRLSKFYIFAHFGSPMRPKRGFGFVRQGTLDDILGMCEVENKEKLFRKRFEEGEHCIVAIEGEQIIGYTWFSICPFHIEDQFKYRVEIDKNCIYAYDAVIKPEYRSMRAIWSFYQFHHYIHEFGRPLARNIVLTIVDYGNNNSIRAQLKLGAEFQKEVIAFHIMGKNFYREKMIDHKNYDFRRALA